MVRFATFQYPQQQLDMLQVKQQDLITLQNKLATGKDFTKSSEAPGKMAESLKSKQTITRFEQYNENIKSANSNMSLMTVSFSNIESLISKANSVALKTTTDTYSQSDYNDFGLEIDQILELLVSESVKKDSSGNYLFSGFKSNVLPFAKQSDGSYLYQGDDGEKIIKVSDNLTVNSTLAGSDVFFSDSATAATAKNGGNTGTGEISYGKIIDSSVWDAIKPNVVTVTYNAGNLTALDSTGATVQLDGQNSISYQDGATINIGGIETTISGTPANTDTFTITPSPKKNIMNILNDVSKALKTESGDTLKSSISSFLNNLTSYTSQNTQNHANIATKQNILDSQEQLNKAVELDEEQTIQDLEGVDFAKVSGELQLVNLSLIAIQRSFGQLTQNSLLRFL